MRVVALDISKGDSHVVVYDDQVCIDEFKINHNQEGFKQLKQVLSEADTEIVFEATGVYSQQIEIFLQSEGIAFCKLNPLLA